MIYAFYSYKGGVGRTLTLAHCAVSMAAMRREAKYKVLAIDLDLEAPGLHRYLPSGGPANMLGFAGLLSNYDASRADSRWLAQTLREDMARDAASRKYIAPVAGAENLFLMPAGTGPGQPLPLNEMTDLLRRFLRQAPTEDSQAPANAGFFRQFRHALKEHFEYVLIDSRTGLSDPAYLSTVLVADCLVGCVRLNRENIDGTRLVIANRLKFQGASSQLPLVIVATPVPARSGKDVEEWIQQAESLVPAIDENDPSVMHRTLFPKVSRVFFDPALELGENMALDTTGKLIAGFSADTPFVKNISELTERLSAENCDHDPIAAEVVETKYWREEKKEKAIQYLFKRIEADPTNSDHWRDISQGYKEVRFNQVVFGWMDGLIQEWQAELNANPGAQLKLAHVCLHRAEIYGRSAPDGGLAYGERAVEFAQGTELEGDAEHIFGQILEELADRKSNMKTRGGELPSNQLASRHFTRAIEATQRHAGKPENAWVSRARNYKKLSKWQKAIADYDSFVVEQSERSDAKAKRALAQALAEQAEVLTREGWYLAALRNLLAAEQLIDVHTEQVGGINLAFAHMGVAGEARQRLEMTRQLQNPDEKLYLHEALVLLLCKDIDASIKSAQIARAFSPTSKVPLMLAVGCLLNGNYEEADSLFRQIAEDDRENYHIGLHALTKLYLGKPDPLAELKLLKKKETDHFLVAMAACAAGEPRLVELAGPETDVSMEDRMEHELPRIASMALVGDWDESRCSHFLSQFSERPYLATFCHWDVDLCLLRKVWDDLVRKQVKSSAGLQWFDTFWLMIDAAQPPPAELLKPRDFKQPFEPDSKPGSLT
jgi:MinD-like ATPase involved in chromosome partitioning or flagellar assembly/tetratricopeptide (TPR) repeat protein